MRAYPIKDSIRGFDHLLAYDRIKTVGTDIPEMIIPVPAAVGGVSGVANPNIGFHGFRFALGLGISITRNAVFSDTTAIGAGEVKVKLSRTI